MKKLAFLSVLLFMFSACGGGREYIKSPLDELIRDMDQLKDFTVILYDMNVEGSFGKKFFHKYKVIKEKEGEEKPVDELTDWLPVSEAMFAQYEQAMGMEIAAKTDGVVQKQIAPPGYSNYVGNSRYGEWRNDSSGNSFWAFYGQYAFMSSMIGLMAGPVYRTSHMDYHRNYRGVGRPYYGGATASGVPRYGTLSDAARSQNPAFFQRTATNSALRNRVNDNISRSTTGRASRSDSRTGTSSTRSRSSSSRGGK